MNIEILSDAMLFPTAKQYIGKSTFLGKKQNRKKKKTVMNKVTAGTY